MAEKTWKNINGVNKEVVPWINVSGSWKKCVPWINVNGVWKKCYDIGTTVYTNLYYIPASGDSDSQSQSRVIQIPNLQSIVSCTVNTGSVSYTINGTSVTIYVSNGSSVRSSTARQETDYRQTNPGGDPSSLPASISYNKGGYTGTLSATGAAYVDSGSPAGNKLCTGSYGIYFIVQDGQRIDNNGDFPLTIPYNDGEYSGNLNQITGLAGVHPDYKDNYNAYIGALMGDTSWSGYIYGLYEATLYKGDTRAWRRNYSGTVYGPTTYYYAYVVTLKYATS